jgi:hypothetical protein
MTGNALSIGEHFSLPFGQNLIFLRFRSEIIIAGEDHRGPTGGWEATGTEPIVLAVKAAAQA